MISALKMTADRIAEVGECRCMTSIAFSHGSVPANSAGTIAKYFATSLAIEKVVSAPRVISSCLPISTDLDELGRIAVEVDHVAGFLGGLGAGVHRQAHVGLRQRRRVVGAVAHHRDQLAFGLLLAEVGELDLGRRFGDEIVDAGLLGDGRRGERVVAGDHDRAQAHLAQLFDALADIGLEDVLQHHDAGDLLASATTSGVAPLAATLSHQAVELRRDGAVLALDKLDDRVRRALADSTPVGQVDAAHARLRGERDELGAASAH